ncbi:MAG: glycosyltransferase family 4 protein [Rhodospirillales bacterium]|nr:glycosyltransferase family 4 protein [Rhodospirillales bacterium]MDE0377691.1 glycosyltransferase family 4 protein [Rhodospirillales bacterium]
MPTVLQVLPSLAGGGGVERGTLDISRALAAAGWRSLIVTGEEADREEAEAAGARHAVLPVARRNPVQAPVAIQRIARLIGEEDADLVHARSRWPAWLAYHAARRARRPFVTTFHGAYSTGWPGKRHYNAIMTRGARVIAISAFIARHIAETYGVEPGRIRTIPRGVDLSVFDPARVGPERIAALRDAWGVPDGQPVVVLPGRMTALKGHLALLDALAEVGERVCCLLVGAADPAHAGYRARIERRIAALGPKHSIRLTGLCRDMPAAYMLADIVVSPSLRPEAFGRVPAEAQAMGRRVIASAHGGARETVIHGETGWLVPPGDAAALADAIRQALRASASQRERMAAAGQAHVRANFTLEGMCRATLDVYRELLPGSS